MSSNPDPSSPTPLALRLALVRDRQVLVERLVPLGQPVTVGWHPDCTLVLPRADGAPRRQALFTAAGSGASSLDPRAVTAGRVRTDDGAVVALDALAERRGVRADRPIPLARADRGKVLVPGGVVLFQLVAVPAPRPIAAGRFRPRLLDEDDPFFLGVLGATAAAAAALMVWVYSVEPVELVELDAVPDYFAHVTLAPPAVEESEPQERSEPPEAPQADPQPAEAVPAAPAPVEAAEPAPRDHALELARRAEGRRQDVRQASFIAGLLDGDEGGVFGDDDAALDEITGQLSGVKAIAAKGSAGPTLRAGRQTTARDVGIGRVGTIERGPDVAVSELAPTAAAPRLDPSWTTTAPAEDRELIDQIRDVVKRGSPGIRACYERRLKADPALAGRLVVGLDVQSGRVGSVRFAGSDLVDAALQSCVRGRVRGWRFDPMVTVSDLELPFALTPG